MDNLEKHLTFTQIGDLCGTSADWARRAWKKGVFGPRYIDISSGCSGKEIRIPESAVREYIVSRSFSLPAVAEPLRAVS